MEFFIEGKASIPSEFNQETLTIVIQNHILNNQKIVGDITVVFCDDDYLLEMNKKHLNHDYYTDIITFDYCENGVISGDLFISVDRIRENAVSQNEPVKNEFIRVVAHGVLHLMGLNDKTEEEKSEMRRNEERIISEYVSRETLSS